MFKGCVQASTEPLGIPGVFGIHTETEGSTYPAQKHIWLSVKAARGLGSIYKAILGISIQDHFFRFEDADWKTDSNCVHIFKKKENLRVLKSVDVSYLFTDELLSEEFTGLKHVGDVIERTESLVFVLVFLLNTNGQERGMLADQG